MRCFCKSILDLALCSVPFGYRQISINKRVSVVNRRWVPLWVENPLPHTHSRYHCWCLRLEQEQEADSLTSRCIDYPHCILDLRCMPRRFHRSHPSRIVDCRIVVCTTRTHKYHHPCIGSLWDIARIHWDCRNHRGRIVCCHSWAHKRSRDLQYSRRNYWCLDHKLTLAPRS